MKLPHRVEFPPTILIEESVSFHNAWARAVQSVLRNGIRITIGDESEPKIIRDAYVLFELTARAIDQIENRKLHPQFPFPHVGHYCEEFTREFLEGYIEKPEDEQFSYLYFERLVLYPYVGYYAKDDLWYEGYIDQMRLLRERLAIQKEIEIASNRDQAITWQPKKDLGSASPPCLRCIQVRYLGKNNVEVHLTWRSRDLYTAWQANIIAVIDMLNREVIRPNGCQIVKLTDCSISAHIYESDDDAKKVKLLSVSPQEQR